MPTREQILDKVTEILTSSFEIPASSITLEARLYEDLNLDSIDAVDMIVELKPFLGTKQVKASDFQKVRTVGDVVEVIAAILHEPA